MCYILLLYKAMKTYQYSSHNTQEAYNKLCRSKEKLDAVKQSGKASSRRKEQLESKEGEVCARQQGCHGLPSSFCLFYSASSNIKRINKDK